MATDPTTPGGMAPFDPSVASGYSTNLTSAAAPQAAAPQQESLIFAGYTTVSTPEHDPDIRTGAGGQGVEYSTDRKPTFLTISQFMSRFDNSDRKDFLKIRNMLIAAGIVAPGAEAYTVRNAFEGLLSNVAQMNMSGAKVTPMGYVKNLIRMNGLDPSEIGSSPDYGADGLFTGTKRSVARTVDEVTEGEAFASLQSTLSQLLGRDATDREIRDFTFKMNQLAAANPSVSKTIARFKDGDLVSEDTRESGGLTDGDFVREAYEDAQSNGEYAEYQSATTYFNAAMGALGAIGQT